MSRISFTWHVSFLFFLHFLSHIFIELFFVQNEIKIQFVGEITYEKLYVIGDTKEGKSMTVFH